MFEVDLTRRRVFSRTGQQIPSPGGKKGEKIDHQSLSVKVGGELVQVGGTQEGRGKEVFLATRPAFALGRVIWVVCTFFLATMMRVRGLLAGADQSGR